MTPQEAQEYGVVPLVIMLTMFTIAFMLIWRHNRRLRAKARAKRIEQQREFAPFTGALPAGQGTVVAVDFGSGRFGQSGALLFADDTLASKGMDRYSWIDTQDWTAMNPCAIGGPGPGNNFGHSAGLASDGVSDH